MKPYSTCPSVRQVTLKPGELFFGNGLVVANTLLGSCVAFTLWHPQLKLGGMCHYLLAHREQYKKNEHHPPGYYATDAISYFVKQVQRLGLATTEFELKFFGGGNMFQSPKAPKHTPVDVASDNIAQGRILLRQNGFHIKAEDVGGTRHRRIYFELATGAIWVKYGQDNNASATFLEPPQ